MAAFPVPEYLEQTRGPRQVQVGLVLGAHHRPARQLDQPGHDTGHHDLRW